jgi:O-antigen/teichoic acid export membrane protein
LSQSTKFVLTPLLRSIGLVLLLNVLTKPLWIIVENLVQDRLGHAAFGKYAALFSLAFLLCPLLDVGTAQYLTAKAASRPRLRKWLAERVLGIRIILALVYLPSVMLLGLVLGYSGQVLWLLFLLSLLQLALAWLLFSRALLQALLLVRLDGFAGVADKTILLPIVGVLLAVGISLNSFVYSQVFVTLFIAGLAYLLVRQNLGALWPRFSYRTTTGVLWRSLPFALVALLYAFHERLGLIWLERRGGDEAAGLFAGAYRWFTAVQMYLWTVLPIFFARFSAQTVIQEREKLLAIAQVVVGLPIVLAASFMMFEGDVLFLMFTHSNATELEAMRIHLVWLGVALLFNGNFNHYATQLAAESRVHLLNYAVGGAVVVNLLFNILGLPILGPISTSIAMAVSFVGLSLAYLGLTMRYSQVTPPWGILRRQGLVAVLVMLVFAFGNWLGFFWLWTTLAATFVWLGSAWLLGLVQPLLSLRR